MSKNGKSSLLVVEDDPGLQKQMRWGFDSYEVVLAGDCDSAIAQMRRVLAGLKLRAILSGARA